MGAFYDYGATMRKGNFPGGESSGAAARGGSKGSGPLDPLCVEIDAVAAEPALPTDEVASLHNWAAEIARSGVLCGVTLSPGALDMLAEVLPPASITAESRTRLERELAAKRAELLAARTLEAECRAESPAILFRDLRERASLPPERAAHLFGVPLATWTAVELNQSPWYRLPAEALPVFAALVREPIDRFLALITLTARRAVLQGIERRMGLALGRCDDPKGPNEARLDTLRVAFARVEEENRGAAAFLERARRAANPPEERDESHPGLAD
jgi:hypothetical protein